MLEQGWSKLGSSNVKSCESRKRRAIASDVILPNYDADFGYVYDPPQLPSISATWPTATGKTKPQVAAYCRHEVVDSEPGKICSALSDFSYAPYILQCMEDVQVLLFVPQSQGCAYKGCGDVTPLLMFRKTQECCSWSRDFSVHWEVSPNFNFYLVIYFIIN